jgi:hypothetical protein
MRRSALLLPALLAALSLPAAAQTLPGYQQGTMQQDAANQWQLVGTGVQISLDRCGTFHPGQQVQFRIADSKSSVSIRDAAGAERTCSIAQYQTTSQQPSGYETGTVLGFMIRRDTVESSTRWAKVYEVRASKLLYLIDYCGAFQAGKFVPGQSLQFRVNIDKNRVYVRRDGAQDYSCQLEGLRLIPPGSSASTDYGWW